MESQVDESLYSRQLYAIGHSAQAKLLGGRVLILGSNGAAQEIAKNLILSGVQTIHFVDDRIVRARDLGTSFLLNENCIGEDRAECVVLKLRDFNSKADIKVVIEGETSKSDYNVVIDCLNKDLGENNRKCREANVPYISCIQESLFGEVFVDCIVFTSSDPSGEPLLSGTINDITDGVMSTLENKRHDLSDGDQVYIYNEAGEEVGLFEVAVVNPFRVKLQGCAVYQQGGEYKEKRHPKVFNHKPFYEIKEPEGILLSEHSIHIHNMFKWGGANFEGLTIYKKTKRTMFMPLVSVLGGFVAQEAIKIIIQKFSILSQFLYIDCMELYREAAPDYEETRYYDLQHLLGDKIDILRNSTVFVVGAGAIGCEHLKNLCMLGINTVVTDMDAIEESNLCRQFLFRRRHIGKMKSQVAADQVKHMNETVKVQYFEEKVGGDTEHIFSDRFLQQVAAVMNALDNVESRLYMDRRCIMNEAMLIDSGTLGLKGNTQCIIPPISESYASSSDATEKSIPLCTVRNFPSTIEHCIEFALSCFEEKLDLGAPDYTAHLLSLAYKLFYTDIAKLLKAFPPGHISKDNVPFWSAPKKCPVLLDLRGSEDIASFVLSGVEVLCEASGRSFCRDQVLAGIKGYEWNSSVDLDVDPNEYSENQQASATPNPTALSFEKDSKAHRDLITACTNLRARCYGIKEGSSFEIVGIAGRIIPALSTTTSIVSGFAAIELCKFLIGLKGVDPYKNTFLALSLPFIGQSTPLEAQKYDTHYGPATCWTKNVLTDCLLRDLIKYLEKDGLKTFLIMADGMLVFNSTCECKYLDMKFRDILPLVGGDVFDGKTYVEIGAIMNDDIDEPPGMLIKIA